MFLIDVNESKARISVAVALEVDSLAARGLECGTRRGKENCTYRKLSFLFCKLVYPSS